MDIIKSITRAKILLKGKWQLAIELQMQRGRMWLVEAVAIGLLSITIIVSSQHVESKAIIEHVMNATDNSTAYFTERHK